MTDVPAEWDAAILWLVKRFTSTEEFSTTVFRESELDEILPARRNRDGFLRTLESCGAIGHKRVGHYVVPLPDEHDSGCRAKLPFSEELRDIRPLILTLESSFASDRIDELMQFFRSEQESAPEYRL